jgi:diguanylate cyclase
VAKLLRDTIQDLLANLMLILTFIIMMAQISKYELPNMRQALPRKHIFCIVSTLLTLLLMIFNIRIESNVAVDLRLIPVVLLLLHVGIVPAMINSVVSVIFHLILYGVNDGTALSILSTLLISGGMSVLSALKMNYNRKWLLGSAFVLAALNFVWMCLPNTTFMQKGMFLSSALSIILSFALYYGLKYINYSSKSYSELKEASITDFLTGLYNYRFFFKNFENQIEILKSNKVKFSVIMIDTDKFKNINDKHGHPTGDYILKELAQIINLNCRRNDIVSRIGGDEFSVILPNTSYENAEAVAERIRDAVQYHEFKLTNGTILNLTVSIGVKVFNNDDANIEDSLKMVDDALYKAKRCGRNTVCAL